jgi:hypothetical protein
MALARGSQRARRLVVPRNLSEQVYKNFITGRPIPALSVTKTSSGECRVAHIS